MVNRSRVVLYVGVTNDLARRVWEHRNHVLKGFTSKYQVDRLVYYEQFPTALSAIMREKEIKGGVARKRMRSCGPRIRSGKISVERCSTTLGGVPRCARD